MKKNVVKMESRKAAMVTTGGVASAQRPWMLIVLGIATFGAVLALQLGGWRQTATVRPQDKVYSAAADPFEPMAVSSRQTGLIEPAGVAKPLQLFGVKVGGSAKEGLAVLGAAEASSRTYVAGALLENGARLTELYADHVVLVRAGQRYTLYMPQKGKSDVVGKSAGLTVGGFGSPAPPLTAPAVRVSDAIRLAAAYEGGQVVGFNVYAGAKAGQMERWGLKNGDVLLTVSGQPMYSPEQVESALDQLAQGGSLQAEVRRGSERVPVTLDGSMLVASAPVPMPPMPPR
jgi:type II secretory pathway component PulC